MPYVNISLTRGKMRRGEMRVTILDEMEVFDQQVAAARSVADQRGDLLARRRVDATPLGGRSNT